jgi:hypothetical protein
VRLAHVADREQVEVPLGAVEMETRRQRAPVFARCMRAPRSITAAITGKAWGKSLKTRIVVSGGLRITALGARFETEGQKLSVAALLDPAAELAREASAASARDIDSP